METQTLTIIDGYIGELGLLNPNDVETITVLKRCPSGNSIAAAKWSDFGNN
jgi:hypothetical protein